MKNKKIIISIIVLGVIALALIGLVIFGIVKGGNFSFLEKTSTIYEQSFENITNIEVDVASYDVKIEESRSDDILVQITGSEKNKGKIQVEQTKENLNITQEQSIICIGLCLYKEEITIYVPENYTFTYNHTSSSGNLEVNTNLLNAQITSTSGDIKTKEIKNGSISSTSGNIDIEKGENLKVESTSGDIKINYVEDLTLNATSGNVVIEEIENQVNASTTSGDITINKLDIKEDSSLSATSGNIKVKLANKLFIDATTNSGNINIDNSNTNPILKINTTSGDIKAK